MSPIFKHFIAGISLGISPLLICYFLFLILPNHLTPNGSLAVSYGIMGIYSLLAIAVFVTAIVLMLIKNKPVIGGVALAMMIMQLIVGVGYMTGV